MSSLLVGTADDFCKTVAVSEKEPTPVARAAFEGQFEFIKENSKPLDVVLNHLMPPPLWGGLSKSHGLLRREIFRVHESAGLVGSQGNACNGNSKHPFWWIVLWRVLLCSCSWGKCFQYCMQVNCPAVKRLLPTPPVVRLGADLEPPVHCRKKRPRSDFPFLHEVMQPGQGVGGSMGAQIQFWAGLEGDVAGSPDWTGPRVQYHWGMCECRATQVRRWPQASRWLLPISWFCSVS